MVDGPGPLLERLLEQRVTLSLKDARELTGRLLAIDEHMNLVLEDTDERTAEVARHLGRILLRGSNVVALHTASGATAKPR